ncbi:MAG: oligoendopeptidase F [Pirellulaceae bacterium]|nr:oligoendopeptidase F [Pirellulaceae bacterium]
MATVKRVPPRSEVDPQDCWNLSSLYISDASWEQDLIKFKELIGGFEQFRGQLAGSAQRLAECLQFDIQVDLLSERLGTYVFLKTTEDQANDLYQGMMGRFQNLAVRASQLASYIRPEILSIPESTMQAMLATPDLEPFHLVLKRITRFKPHTLSDKEESLLAMQGEMAQTASKIFRQLNDADLKFGFVTDANGESVELTNSTFSQLLISPDRGVRRTAFHQYYEQFHAHENTLAATLAGSVHTDVYYSKARGYESALAAALFPDNIPQAVYDNLISTVRGQLPAVHHYLEVRRKKMNLPDLHHYDTYVPILADMEQTRPWDDAVSTVIDSLEPLGEGYCQKLKAGLNGGWCDRYPNQGKQSGAFSCGSFEGNPYIMMNYKPTVLNDLFTLTHEAGHSMHSHYSARTQPFQYYNYTIFVAEVASTFNEQLLTHYLLKNSSDTRLKAYLLNHEIDSIRATIVRQTMFAEFEKLTHEMAQTGEGLTVQAFRESYSQLLKAYFGPNFVIDEQLSLECFRIPHFYRAFYVYKYATGLAAAIALSRRVLEGGPSERADYLRFLSSGCAKDPLELLADAGVDMTTPEPIETALKHFDSLVSQLDQLV